MYSAEEAARHPGQTYWFNGTDRPVKVTLRRGPKSWAKDRHTGRRVITDSGVQVITWQPKQGLWLSSEFDESIQVIDETASPPRIISGRAPQLTKNAGGAELHPALDVEGQKIKEATQQAADALGQQAAANAGLVVALAAMNGGKGLQPAAPAPAAAPIDPEVLKAQAKIADAEAKKAEAEAKKADAEARKAEADRDAAAALSEGAKAEAAAGKGDGAKDAAAK